MPPKPALPGDAPKPWLLANHRALVFIAIFVFIALGLLLTKDFLFDLQRSKSMQAVFLSNGQVYFGHVKFLNRQWAELTHIYYLQVSQPLQAQQPSDQEQQQTQPQLTLIKLGEELHGPLDKMVINRDHILFVEDLQESGRVVQTIRQSGGAQ